MLLYWSKTVAFTDLCTHSQFLSTHLHILVHLQTWSFPHIYISYQCSYKTPHSHINSFAKTTELHTRSTMDLRCMNSLHSSVHRAAYSMPTTHAVRSTWKRQIWLCAHWQRFYTSKLDIQSFKIKIEVDKSHRMRTYVKFNLHFLSYSNMFSHDTRQNEKKTAA